MTNEEKRDRKWLAYSKSAGKDFCKLFASRSNKLSSDGLCDWVHLGNRLQEYEQSFNHTECTKTVRIYDTVDTKSAIDRTDLELLEKEMENLRQRLKRIIIAVRYVAQHKMSVRGTSDKLYRNNNGNFLGLIEMIAEFNPALQEHLRRVKTQEIHDH
ncbi:uncharacterized protein LOC124594438 [Schistocerca americana]|uniref:uncharacterized protein LOC124594438 n=1 Tax=Schistocerca americana TaxID=7009 RepID=UPI001F4F7378|nr:uncharacterized protein LOC124594438 [Schistocerca americana]